MSKHWLVCQWVNLSVMRATGVRLGNVQAPGARLGIWAHVQANTVKHRSMHGDCRTASLVSANNKTWFKNQWSGFVIDEIEVQEQYDVRNKFHSN